MPIIPPQFYLVDAHNFLHRNYHALPKLTTSAGLEVGALYGFLRWLLKMLREKKPRYVAVCFDSPGGCARRKALWPAYKANRTRPDEALVNQLNLARDMVRALGLPMVAQSGFEADDLMAFLACEAAKLRVPSAFVTSDKDVYQFLSEYISIWPSGGKDGLKGPEAAKERFGVDAPFLTDYLALVGDVSDNVPGVAGIGPKGAVDLIEKFGHLEDILRAAHNDNPAMRPLTAKRLLADEGNALLSKQLVVFDKSLSLPFSLDDYRVHLADAGQLQALFTQYEFKNLLDFLPAGAVAVPAAAKPAEPDLFAAKPSEPDLFAAAAPDLPPPTPQPAHEPAAQEEPAEPVMPPQKPFEEISLDEALCRAAEQKRFFFQTEEDFLCVGLDAAAAAIVPLSEVSQEQLSRLTQLLTADDIEKITYDFKLNLRLLDINLHGHFVNAFDGKLAYYLLNPSQDLSFAGACATYFSVTISGEETKELLALYNRFIWPLCEELAKKLKASGQYELYRQLELPLMMILSDMEYTGFKVDTAWLREFQGVLDQETERLRQEVNRQAGREVNVNSPKQLGELLFEEMKIPPSRKNKTGYSTDESVLEEIAQTYPIARTILDYRANNKLKTTYVDNLLIMADEHQRVHSYLDQTGTVTGRLSSSGPNLQNIPVRTERGRLLRKAFCAEAGNVLLSVDYSQIDLRVLAHETNDPALVRTFLEGGDIHTQTAADIFGVMPLMVTNQMRAGAKAVNFGIIYGQGPMGLSQALNISLREAKEYIDNYFRTYRTVREWIDYNAAQARKNGYVKTMLGHVRYLPEFHMGLGFMSSFAQRAAINTIVQGGSADIIKRAMLDVFNACRQTPVKMTMQVHDELIFELPREMLMPWAAKIKQLMENAVKLRVPLLTAAKAGNNWYELEKLPL